MTAQLSYVTARSGFGKSTAKIEDFRPKWGKPRQPSNEEILEMFRQAQP